MTAGDDVDEGDGGGDGVVVQMVVSSGVNRTHDDLNAVAFACVNDV